MKTDRLTVILGAFLLGSLVGAELMHHVMQSRLDACGAAWYQTMGALDYCLQTWPCQEDMPCWDCATMGNRICGLSYTGWDLAYHYGVEPAPITEAMLPESVALLRPRTAAFLAAVPVYMSVLGLAPEDQPGFYVDSPPHAVLAPGCSNPMCAQHEAIHALQDLRPNPSAWYRLTRLNPAVAYWMGPWLRNLGYVPAQYGIEAQAYLLQDYPNTPPPSSVQGFALHWFTLEVIP